MELELRVGLAHLLKRTVVIPDSIPILHSYSPRKTLRDLPRRLASTFDARYGPHVTKLTDLFEIPEKFLTYRQYTKQYPNLTPVTLPWTSTTNSAASCYFASPSGASLGSETAQRFANGRLHSWTTGPELDEEPCLTSHHRMFGLYSYFFLVSREEFAELRDLIQRIRPKAPYSNFAAEVAAALGRFSAVHIRLGDLLNDLTGRYGVQAPTPREIANNVAGVVPRSEHLLICTDTPEDNRFFQPLRELFPHAEFLDELLVQKSHWRRRLQALPFCDYGVVALVSQLIAGQADCFIGSLFSTFTAFIHRQRLFERDERSFKYVFSPFQESHLRLVNCEFRTNRTDMFSWSRFAFPLPPHFHSWFREWPEAVNCALPES